MLVVPYLYIYIHKVFFFVICVVQRRFKSVVVVQRSYYNFHTINRIMQSNRCLRSHTRQIILICVAQPNIYADNNRIVCRKQKQIKWYQIILIHCAPSLSRSSEKYKIIFRDKQHSKAAQFPYPSVSCRLLCFIRFCFNTR